MTSFRRNMFLVLGFLFATGAQALAQAPVAVDPNREKDLQGAEIQKEVKEDTDRLVQRLSAVLNILEFYNVSPDDKQNQLKEVARSLSGLSQQQMNEVIRLLRDAANNSNPEMSQKAREEARDRHREIVKKLDDILKDYALLRTLEEMADRLDELAGDQFNLCNVTKRIKNFEELLAKTEVTPAEKSLLEIRNTSHFRERKEEPDDQATLRRRVTDVLGQIHTLRSKLKDQQDQKDRIANMENLADKRAVREHLSDLVQKLRNTPRDKAALPVHLSAAAELQMKTAADLAELARTLRAPVSALAAETKALEDIKAAIAQQKDLQEKPNKQAEQEIKNNPKTLEKILDVANKQARLEFDVDKIRNLLDPHDKELAKEINKAEQTMEKATTALQKTDPAKAFPEQKKASETLENVHKELAELIAKHQQEQVDPLANLKKISEDLAKVIADQKQNRDQTKEIGADKQNPKIPALAEKQEDLSNRTKAFKKEPLPGQPKVQESIDQAVNAMKKATDNLKAQTPPEAVKEQDKAITALEKIKKDVDQKADEMQKRREEIANLDHQSQKLDKLAQDQTDLAKKANEAAQDHKNPEAPKAAKDLGAKQAQLTPEAKDIAQNLDKIMPKVAEKVNDASKEMEGAKKQFEDRKLEPAAKHADTAKDKLNDAKKHLDDKIAQLQAEEIQQQQAMQPKLDPESAQRDIENVLQDLQKAEDRLEKMADKKGKSLAEQQREIAQAAEKKNLPKEAAVKATENLEKHDLPKAIEEQTKELADLNKVPEKPLQPSAVKEAPMLKEGAEPSQPKAGQPKETQAKEQEPQPPATKGQNQGQPPPSAKKGAENPPQPVAKEATEQPKAPAQPKDMGQPLKPAEPPQFADKMPLTPSEAKTPGQLAKVQEDLLERTKELALAKEDTEAAQATLPQAKDKAPQAIQPQLDKAGNKLAKANEDISKGDTEQAKKDLHQAKSALEKALMALAAVPPAQPKDSLAMEPKDGQPKPGQPKEGQPKPEQPKEGKQPTASNKMDNTKGDGLRKPSTDSEAKASQLPKIEGDGAFLALPPREREIIRQAINARMPPEYAAEITQYYINIARGQAAPSTPSLPAAPNK